MAYRRNRDWPGQPRRHAKAAKLGWKRRRRSRRDPAAFSNRDWPNDAAGHRKAAKLAWKRRRRKSRAKLATSKKRAGGAGGYVAAYGATFRRRGRPRKYYGARDASMMDPSPRFRRRFRRRRSRY